MTDAMTRNDKEVLNNLYWVNRESNYPMKWARPLDLGGRNGSHHSGTLRKLERKGLVQAKQRGWPDPDPDAPITKRYTGRHGERGAKVYRITDQGCAAVVPPHE